MTAAPPASERRRPRPGSLERPVNGRLYRSAWLLVALPVLLLAFKVSQPPALSAQAQPPAFDSGNKQYCDAVEHIRVTAKKHGIASGIHVADAAQAQRRMKEGFQFIAVASDAGFMMAKAKEVTNALGIGGGKAVARY